MIIFAVEEAMLMVMLMAMLMTNDDNLYELHMPASPNDIVQPNLVLPTKLHPKKPVPLRRRQLLAIRDRHALRYFLSVLLLLRWTEFVCATLWLTWKSLVRLQSMVLLELPHCTELFIKLTRDLTGKTL